jgi:hypothetical protein
MTVANFPNDERDEYMELFLQLIDQESEATLREAEELRDHGFLPVFVRGSPMVLWSRWDGCFTADAALEEIAEREDE